MLVHLLFVVFAFLQPSRRFTEHIHFLFYRQNCVSGNVTERLVVVVDIIFFAIINESEHWHPLIVGIARRDVVHDFSSAFQVLITQIEVSKQDTWIIVPIIGFAPVAESGHRFGNAILIFQDIHSFNHHFVRLSLQGGDSVQGLQCSIPVVGAFLQHFQHLEIFLCGFVCCHQFVEAECALKALSLRPIVAEHLAVILIGRRQLLRQLQLSFPALSQQAVGITHRL